MSTSGIDSIPWDLQCIYTRWHVKLNAQVVTGLQTISCYKSVHNANRVDNLFTICYL
jgi:hypothetical protein